MHAIHLVPPHPPSLDHKDMYREYIMKLLIMKFSPARSYFMLGHRYLPQDTVREQSQPVTFPTTQVGIT